MTHGSEIPTIPTKDQEVAETLLMARVKTKSKAVRELWQAVISHGVTEAFAVGGSPGDVRLLGTLRDRLIMWSWLQPVMIKDGALIIRVEKGTQRLTVPFEACLHQGLMFQVECVLEQLAAHDGEDCLRVQLEGD